MVGNKAQKAVAAALTGVLAMGGIAPAFAGVWTDGDPSWYRVDGSHEATYTLGTYDVDDGEIKSGTSGVISGTEFVEGENRYDTMFDAVNYNEIKGLYTGTKYVVLASGTSSADSLVAAGVAGMLAEDQSTGQTNGDSLQKKIEVPVVLTPGDKLCIQAKRAIKYFAENYKDGNGEDFTVYIVGGTAAVSKDVEKAVADIKGGKDKDEISVERLAGDDRMATSLVAAKVVDDDGWLDDDLAESNNAAYVANGWAPADALSVSSSAYKAGQPILLTGSDGKLSEEQLDYLKKLDDHVQIAVIGGPAQPSAQQLWDAGVTRAGVSYIAGTNRYETSAAVIEWHVDHGFAHAAIAVASGANDHMADALIGGAFVGANGGVLALVDGVDEVTALKEAYAKIKKYDQNGQNLSGTHEMAPKASSYIIGGESAIDAAFAKKLNKNFPVKA